MSPVESFVRFVVAAAIVLAASRVASVVARRLNQPGAVGEMVAGIVLGPSVFGMLAPALQAALFPVATQEWLRIGGQLGVALYMFLVGVEFRTDLFRARVGDAVAVSIAGIVVPFGLGAALAGVLAQSPGFFPEGVGRGQAMFFLGASMSITAFPMLARIVEDRGLAGTALGTLALAAGAIGDAVAWCLLAGVLASLRRDAAIATTAIVGGAAYTAAILFAGPRVLRPLAARAARAGRIDRTTVAMVLAAIVLCGALADAIGVHAVFGTFVLGVAMPRGGMADGLTARLTPVIATLLPLFFAYSGLNTRLDLVDSVRLWAVAALVIVVASVGKGGACWAAARWSGADPTTARAIGILMNARGMMELIILNIGLQAGLITPALFSIMVVMAVATTLATTPLVARLAIRAPRAAMAVES